MDDIRNFHIDFFPSMRSRNQIKWNGRMGTLQSICPEEQAEELRRAYARLTSR